MKIFKRAVLPLVLAFRAMLVVFIARFVVYNIGIRFELSLSVKKEGLLILIIFLNG
jgi:hypothetical protein